MGFAEELTDRLFVESVAMIALSIVGMASVVGIPSAGRVYIYKIISLVTFLVLGGYMSFTMLMMILRNLVRSKVLVQGSADDGLSVSVTYTIYIISTLTLLGATVSSHSLHSSIEAQEEILKLIKYTSGR